MTRLELCQKKNTPLKTKGVPQRVKIERLCGFAKRF